MTVVMHKTCIINELNAVVVASNDKKKCNTILIDCTQIAWIAKIFIIIEKHSVLSEFWLRTLKLSNNTMECLTNTSKEKFNNVTSSNAYTVIFKHTKRLQTRFSLVSRIDIINWKKRGRRATNFELRPCALTTSPKNLPLGEDDTGESLVPQMCFQCTCLQFVQKNSQICTLVTLPDLSQSWSLSARTTLRQSWSCSSCSDLSKMWPSFR